MCHKNPAPIYSKSGTKGSHRRAECGRRPAAALPPTPAAGDHHQTIARGRNEDFIGLKSDFEQTGFICVVVCFVNAFFFFFLAVFY